MTFMWSGILLVLVLSVKDSHIFGWSCYDSPDRIPEWKCAAPKPTNQGYLSLQVFSVCFSGQFVIIYKKEAGVLDFCEVKVIVAAKPKGTLISVTLCQCSEYESLFASYELCFQQIPKAPKEENNWRKKLLLDKSWRNRQKQKDLDKPPLPLWLHRYREQKKLCMVCLLFFWSCAQMSISSQQQTASEQQAKRAFPSVLQTSAGCDWGWTSLPFSWGVFLLHFILWKENLLIHKRQIKRAIWVQKYFFFGVEYYSPSLNSRCCIVWLIKTISMNKWTAKQVVTSTSLFCFLANLLLCFC